MTEFEPDSIGEERQDAAFLFFRGGHLNHLAFMAARGTKEKGLAALDAHDFDTLVAHHVVAMGALVESRGLCVAVAGNHAAFQQCRRLGALAFILRDHYIDFGGLNDQFDITKTHFLTTHKPGFLDGFAIDEGAVGGTAIAQQHSVS